MASSKVIFQTFPFSPNLCRLLWTLKSETLSITLLNRDPLTGQGFVAEIVYKSIQEGVDGVVVLHGTDTMQYTASALSFMLGYPEVPVVLTGAMIPGGNPGSDGPSNIRAAIRVAAQADLGHVCVIFSAGPDMVRKLIIKGTQSYEDTLSCYKRLRQHQ